MKISPAFIKGFTPCEPGFYVHSKLGLVLISEPIAVYYANTLLRQLAHEGKIPKSAAKKKKSLKYTVTFITYTGNTGRIPYDFLSDIGGMWSHKVSV